MKSVSYLTLLGYLGVSLYSYGCANAHERDDNYGWGRGTPTGLRSSRSVASTPPELGEMSPQWGRGSPLSSSTSSGSRGSIAPASNRVLVEESVLLTLQQENELLRSQIGQQADSQKKVIGDDVTLAVLSFRLLNLSVGYPDPTSTNYDYVGRRYYDAATGIFPPKQSLAALKHKTGAELIAWNTRQDAKREEYKAAYQHYQKMKEREERKALEAVEDVVQSVQSLDIPSSSDAASPSSVPGPSVPPTPSKKEQKYTQAKVDKENAQRRYDAALDALLKEHPARIEISNGEREVIFRSSEDLDRKFTWGHVAVPLNTPYSTQPNPRNDPRNVRSYYVTDPIEIMTGLNTLKWMIPHLQNEIAIFQYILTHYNRDFTYNVSGVFSLRAWQDWYRSLSFDKFKTNVKQQYPSAQIRNFSQPKTDQAVTLRLLRRDDLGQKLRKYLDRIPPYVETPIQEERDAQFLRIMRGADEVQEVSYQGSSQSNNLTVSRTFPMPVSIPFVSVKKTMVFLAPSFGQGAAAAAPASLNPALNVSVPISFNTPKGVKMVTEYVSPKAMGFHRQLWGNVMRELTSQSRSFLPTALRSEDVREYQEKSQVYESLLKQSNLLLKTLQVSSSYMLPAPFEFFFSTGDAEQEVSSAEVIDLSNQGITDRDINHRRVLPGGQSEPVLHRYSTIDLSANGLQQPSPQAFSTKLISLNVSGNQLPNLQFAVTLTSLTELDASEQLLADNLAPFGNVDVAPLATLKSLKLVHTGLSQFSPLAGFFSLTNLDLSNNNLVTVAPLKSLINLVNLKLAKNQLTSLTDLEALFNLRYLDVSHNAVKSLNSAVKLPALETLVANACNFQGEWSSIFPVVSADSDPRFLALIELQLKDNPAIKWHPYKNTQSRSYSSIDERKNNTAFNTLFPKLQTLRLAQNVNLQASDDNPVTLSALHR